MSLLRKFMDRIARECGYFTADDVASCVRSAEEAANASAGTGGTNQAVSDERLLDALPDGYIRYFVSYHNGSGYGCLQLARQQPIRSFTDVQATISLIEDTLRRNHGWRGQGVVVLNWQRFELPILDGAREPLPSDAPPAVVLRLVA